MFGTISPVEGSIVSPDGDALKTPPVVPVRVTPCAAVTEEQNSPLYPIVACGRTVIVTGEVAVTTPHPFAAAIVLVTRYAPGVLPARLTNPVAVLMLNPFVELKIPETPPPE